MLFLRSLVAALLLGGGAVAIAANTDTEFHLNELLASHPDYQQAWRDVLEDESRLPEWVINLSGVAPPMLAVADGGDKYLVGQICEAHNCFSQRLYAAFTWDKDKAYALLVQVPAGLPLDRAPSEHASLRWLGKPDEAVKKLLTEQLQADPNWY